jgi:hypothetical protein
MEFEMHVDMDNAAFENYPEDELGRILAKVAKDVYKSTSGTVRDINGNTVCKWVIFAP